MDPLPRQIYNSDLYLLKRSLLKDNTFILKKQYDFNCSFHGIKLCFSTDSWNLIEDLEKTLPPSWKEIEKTDFTIYHHDFLHFNIPTETWADEASQDCFTEEKNKLAIQRDFAAYQVSENEIHLYCEGRLSDGLHNFLRWFLSQKLIENNKFVLHSSCILDKLGQAHFFLGHSGAGKTTITSFSQNRLILGDDMNLISCEQGQYRAEPGAIGGLFRSQLNYDEQSPIKAFYWLKQASRTELQLLTSVQAQQKILASFANLFWEDLEQTTVEQLMLTAQSLSQIYPCYELSFTKSDDFWKLIDHE